MDCVTHGDMGLTLAALVTLGLCLQSSWSEKKQIYLAGTFPIGGSEGWQGGQVGDADTIRQRQISSRDS